MTVNQSEDITPYENKSFREIVTELREHRIRSDRTYKELIQAAIKKGQLEGISNEEIRSQILEAGIAYNTMIEYIPDEMKQHQEHVRSRPPPAVVTNRMKVGTSNLHGISNDSRTNTRLVIEDEELQILPPPQLIIESELEPQVRPIKPSIIINKQQLTQVKFPKTLWKDKRLEQRFYGLDIDYIILRVDEQGFLSL